jgi:hypothetical protein
LFPRIARRAISPATSIRFQAIDLGDSIKIKCIRHDHVETIAGSLDELKLTAAKRELMCPSPHSGSISLA